MKIRFLAPAVLLATLVAVTPASADQWQPTATTVAGGNGDGSGADQLSNPYDVTVDADGSLYVADNYNNRVKKFMFTNGEPSAPVIVMGGNGQGDGPNQLDIPRGVLVGPDGTIYVSDHSNARVQMRTVDANGELEATVTIAGGNGVGADADQLKQPYGLALDADGSLYIADTGNHRVQRITFDDQGVPQGAETVAGGLGAGSDSLHLHYPRGIDIGADGSLYIADATNHRVQLVTFDSAGAPQPAVTIAGGNGSGPDPDQFATPYDLDLDDEGTLYIADTSNNRIQRIMFDANGAPQDAVTVFGNGEGTGDDQLDHPRGITVTAGGLAYIADDDNHRVQRVTFDTVAPSAVLSSPASARVGQTVAVDFSCADTGGSGVSSCTANLDGDPISSGDQLSTSARGTRTLVLSSSDNVANSSNQTITIVVHGKRELIGSYANATARPGAIARLYMATFTRQPEAQGFEFWTASANVTGLQDVADFFAVSPEFVRLYGSTSDSDFVDLMYANVFDREADSIGHRYWLGQLDGGMTQAEMLRWFSESPEFKADTYTS